MSPKIMWRLPLYPNNRIWRMVSYFPQYFWVFHWVPPRPTWVDFFISRKTTHRLRRTLSLFFPSRTGNVSERRLEIDVSWLPEKKTNPLECFHLHLSWLYLRNLGETSRSNCVCSGRRVPDDPGLFHFMRPELFLHFGPRKKKAFEIELFTIPKCWTVSSVY